MDGRRRGKRTEPPPATAPTTRQTRQARRDSRNEQSQDATVSVPQTQPTNGYGPLPRRGAPKTGKVAPSIASIPTQLGNQSDEYEDEDTDESPEPSLVGDEVQVEQAGDPEDAEVDDGEYESFGSEIASQDSNQVNYYKAIMPQTIPDLEYTAKRLIDHLKNPEPEIQVWKGILRFKADAFTNVRSLYHAVGPFAPFLSVDMVDHVPPNMVDETKAAVRYANVATALSGLHSLDTEEFDAVLFWEKFDEAFVQAFIQFPSARGAQCALEVRTQHVIAKLEAAGRGAKPYEIIAEAFCEEDGKKPADLIVSGPWRSAGFSNRDDHIGACHVWLKRLLPFVKPKNAALKNLKEAFPLEETRSALRSWFLDEDDQLVQHRTPQQSQESDHVVAAGSEAGVEPDDSVVESQEIVRASRGPTNPTLFRDPSSIHVLNRSERSKAPPSNQQGSVRRSGPPSDYPDESNSAILGAVPRSTATIPRSSRQSHVTVEDVAEDARNDNDPFGTPIADIINKGKRRASANVASPPSSKRPRVPSTTYPSPELRKQRVSSYSRPAAPSARPASRQRHSNGGHAAPDRRQTSSSFIPPSAPVPPSSGPPASSADFRAIAERKRAIVSSQRISRPPATQVRRPWSDSDSQLLVDLIRTHLSRWSVIAQLSAMTEEEMQAVENGGAYPKRPVFQAPRNQQACRDKARNMKVDFLLTDAVLPPGFDTVVLSGKEIRRVENLGKNPNRKEANVVMGRPVNTEI